MFLAESGIGESFLAIDRPAALRNVGDHHPRPKLIFCSGDDDDLADAARHIANSDVIDWPTERRRRQLHNAAAAVAIRSTKPAESALAFVLPYLRA
jgi:hypothetical protein